MPVAKENGLFLNKIGCLATVDKDFDRKNPQCTPYALPWPNLKI